MIIPFHRLNEMFMFDMFGLKLTPLFKAEYTKMGNGEGAITIDGEKFGLNALRYAMMTRQQVRSDSSVDVVEFRSVLEAKMMLPAHVENRITWRR